MAEPANPFSSIFYTMAAKPAGALHSPADRGKQFPPVIGRPADQRKQKETEDIIGRQRQVGQPTNVTGLQLGLNVTPAIKVGMQEFLSQNDLTGASNGCRLRSKTRSLSTCRLFFAPAIVGMSVC